MSRVAVVTGSNKGIGFGIVKELANSLSTDWTIYLTSRNEELGLKALNELGNTEKVKYHQLDISNEESRKRFIEHMKATHPIGVEIWINNAGIAYSHDSKAPFTEQAVETLKVNLFATVDMAKEALPIMTQNGRLVNVASMVSIMALKQCNDEIYKRVTDPNTTLDQVLAMGKEFVQYGCSEEAKNKGWPATCYGVSKMLLVKAIQEMAKLENPKKVIITSCCPGYVDTDMTNHKGTKTVKEGTETPIFLAMLEDQSQHGVFFSEKKKVDFSRETEFKI